MTYQEVYELASKNMYEAPDSPPLRFARECWKKEGSFSQVFSLLPVLGQEKFADKDGLIQVIGISSEDREATDWIVISPLLR